MQCRDLAQFGTHALPESQQLVADLDGGIGMVDEGCASTRYEDAPSQHPISPSPAHALTAMTPNNNYPRATQISDARYHMYIHVAES